VAWAWLASRSREDWLRASGAVALSLMIWVALWRALPELSWATLELRWLWLGALASLVIWLLRAARLWGLGLCTARVALKVVACHGGLLRVTPMRLGELSLPYLLKRWAEVPHAHSGALLIWLRLCELIILCAATLISLWLSSALGAQLNELSAATLSAQRAWLSLGLICALAALASLSRLIRPLLSVGLSLMERLSGALSLTRLTKRLEALSAELELLPELPWRSRAWLLLMSAMIFLTQLTLFGSALWSCAVSLGLAELTLGSSCAHVAGVIPLPTLGNVGSHELGWTLGFMWVGVPREAALCSALLSQLFTLAMSLLWWGVASFISLPSQRSGGRCVLGEGEG